MIAFHQPPCPPPHVIADELGRQGVAQVGERSVRNREVAGAEPAALTMEDPAAGTVDTFDISSDSYSSSTGGIRIDW